MSIGNPSRRRARRRTRARSSERCASIGPQRRREGHPARAARHRRHFSESLRHEIAPRRAPSSCFDARAAHVPLRERNLGCLRRRVIAARDGAAAGDRSAPLSGRSPSCSRYRAYAALRSGSLRRVMASPAREAAARESAAGEGAEVRGLRSHERERRREADRVSDGHTEH